MEVIKNVRQRVYRKRLKSVEYLKKSIPDQVKEANADQRKRFAIELDDDEEQTRCQKKVRVQWDVDLHNKFVEAVNLLGGESNAAPMMILEIMNCPGLTRAHISSHLQYREKKKSQMTRGFSPRRATNREGVGPVTSSSSTWQPVNYTMQHSMCTSTSGLANFLIRPQSFFELPQQTPSFASGVGLVTSGAFEIELVDSSPTVGWTIQLLHR